jgi:hypothetical protein
MSQSLHPIPGPAFSTAPHVTDPSGVIVAFWTEPRGVLMQFSRPARGTTAMAEWLVGPGLELLLARFPGACDLRVILDMRMMTGRSATARAVLIQSAKAVHGRVGHVVLLPSTQLGRGYVAIVEGTARMLRLAGLPVDVEHGLAHVIARHGIRPIGSGEIELGPEVAREHAQETPGARRQVR